MPQLVEVENVGLIEVPDEWDARQIQSSLRRKFPTPERKALMDEMASVTSEPKAGVFTPGLDDRPQSTKREQLELDMQAARSERKFGDVVEGAFGIAKPIVEGANPLNWPHADMSGVAAIREAISPGTTALVEDTTRRAGQFIGDTIKPVLDFAAPFIPEETRMEVAAGTGSAAAGLAFGIPEAIPLVAAGAALGPVGALTVASGFSKDMIVDAKKLYEQSKQAETTGDTATAKNLKVQAFWSALMAASIPAHTPIIQAVRYLRENRALRQELSREGIGDAEIQSMQDVALEQSLPKPRVIESAEPVLKKSAQMAQELEWATKPAEQKPLPAAEPPVLTTRETPAKPQPVAAEATAEQVATAERGGAQPVPPAAEPISTVKPESQPTPAAEVGAKTPELMTPEQKSNLATNIQRFGWKPEDYGMTKAEVDSLARKPTQPKEQEPSFRGGPVVRYTLEDGTGLLNRRAYDLGKLTDSEAQELSELLGFSLQQPLDVKGGATFAFTIPGEKKHRRMISLLKKAATGKVVRTEIDASITPTWESSDGQLAFSEKPVREGDRYVFKPPEPAKPAENAQPPSPAARGAEKPAEAGERILAELKDAEEFTGKASIEAEKATQAWARHSIDVVDPLKKKVRESEKAANKMQFDAARTKPETKAKLRLTKKAFFEKYGVKNADEANALWKEKNKAWQDAIDELEKAQERLKELERVKEQAAKNWSSAATRAGDLRRQAYPKVREADVGQTQPPSPAAPGTQTQPKAQATSQSTGAAAGGENLAGAKPGQPLSPLQTGNVTLTLKSQRQVITDLAKGLKLPIRFGRLVTRSAGYFDKLANLIASRRAVSVPVVSHEVGHKLDSTFKLSSDPSIASELNALGDTAMPGSMSSWKPNKGNKYKLGEGVAEFVRIWLTYPEDAIKVAPNTYKAFERIIGANKDIGYVMRQAQEDIQLWRAAPSQARLRSQISVGDNPTGTRYTLSQSTRDLVDDLHFIKIATEEAGRNIAGGIKPTDNPYINARNLRGSYGMAETFIRNGIIDFKTKAVKLGTSLEDALKPVAGRINDFRDWIVAKRAQEKISQGVETGLVPADVKAVAAKFDGDAVFNKAFSDVKAWNDAILDYAVDAGLVTKESAANMRAMNQDYVPWARVFEVGAGESPSTSSSGLGRGLNVGKPGAFRKMKGSSRQIVDPIETMVRNAYTIITAAEKASIQRSIADFAKVPNMGKWVERVSGSKEAIKFEVERIRKQLEDAGADLTNVPDDLLLTFYKPSKRAPFGENTIAIRNKDKFEFYRLQRDLYDTFHALDLEDASKLWRILSTPAQVLRAGVTLEPSFSALNLIRDTFGAAVLSKYGALPFETTLRGVAAMLGNRKLVSEWAASGGKSAIEINYFDRDKLQTYLRTKISNELTPSERASIWLRSPLAALRWLAGSAEEATRIGEYQIAYNKLRSSGMQEGEARRLAAFESRDRQDFAKGGAKTKILRQIAPFWNAQLQANVRLAQAFKNNPIRTTLQGIAFVTLPKLLEQAVNWDDEDYWARKQWERDLFFLIPYGKDESGHTKFVRIPTPFEIGIIFGTMPGRMLQWAKTNDPEAAKGIPSILLKQSVPNPIPPPVQLAFEVALSGKQGWNVWANRPIVPERMAALPPNEQYTEHTSRLAKKVGKAIGVSPMKIDHVIERTSGGLGKTISGKQVPGGRFFTAPLAYSNQAVDEFYNILEVEEATKGPSLKHLRKTAEKMSNLRKTAMNSDDEASRQSIMDIVYSLADQDVKMYKSK